MSTAVSVDSIIDIFASPSLPKHPRKTEYSRIRENHSLLTANALSIECPLRGGQNG